VGAIPKGLFIKLYKATMCGAEWGTCRLWPVCRAEEEGDSFPNHGLVFWIR